jgi:Domain of unknown function (DUF4281)
MPNYSASFVLTNLYVLPFWALMIFAPHWTWTRRICGSLLIIVPLAAAYSVLLIVTVVQIVSGGMMSDLTTSAGLLRVLSETEGTAVGWTHYLAFDLFVGRWAYLDSRERGILAWWVSPTLFFVLMVGPLGLLLYLGVRWLHGRRQKQA